MARWGTRNLKQRIRRASGYALVSAVCLLLLAAAALYAAFLASVPRFDGRTTIPGLHAEVVVRRDALGTPDIFAADREDLTRAIGFIEAQDRFFQMDQFRRAAAGELSALLGPAMVDLDKSRRLHGMRAIARQAVGLLGPDDRRLLAAFSEGVNVGLQSLGARPPEYIVLRQQPRPWRDEDTLLAMYAAAFEVADPDGRVELMKGMATRALSGPAFRFYFPRGSAWDAAYDDSRLPEPPIPSPDEFRASGETAPVRPIGTWPTPTSKLGSNAWVVDGTVSSTGAALLANDIHLAINVVPGFWYRLSVHWKEPGGSVPDRWAVGSTIPGLPGLLIGSNGSIAWGLTDAASDVTDVVQLEMDPHDPARYRTPDGWRRIERRSERIEVAGAPAITEAVENSVWGPVLPAEPGRPRLALRSVVHDPAAISLDIFGVMRMTSAPAALAWASRCRSVEPLNFLVGDRDGRIGWTIMGVLPRRVGFDGEIPTSWADGTRRWEGYVAPEEHPRRESPQMHRIWSANQRTLAPSAVSYVGDDHTDRGARAGQIRDDLRALETAAPADMLAIQTDNRAIFLRRWQTLLGAVLQRMSQAPDHDSEIDAMRAAVEHWGGRAATDSVGFRLVWLFRQEAIGLLLEPMIQRCHPLAPDRPGPYWSTSETPEAAWRLVTERPSYLLSPRFTSYDALLESAVTSVLDHLRALGGPPGIHTWGELNYLRIQHPFSRAIPVLSRWLDVPGGPMAGDYRHMPSIANPFSGASQRLAVSPGHEAEGYFHMPTGESGHFLSPYYRAGSASWRSTTPLPLLPGTPEHSLTLSP